MSPTVAAQSRRRPRSSVLDHDVAMRLAATEYDRFAALLGDLGPDDWSAPTECSGWDVRAMAGHVLGMAQMAASVIELGRQQLASRKRAARDGTLLLDGLTASQVDKNSELTTAELVTEMRARGRAAARARRRTPGFVRRRTMPGKQRVGEVDEPWTLGFLLDTILTRDPFLHRSDITRATGRAMTVEPDHEGVIVDDVVREWADRHRQPYRLTLTGPAGGTWQEGEAPQVTMEAIEFCRVLSGRAPGEGLLATPVPF